MKILVTAATEHGSTGEIAEAIGSALRHRGLEVEVIAPGDVGDVEAYDAVVLGSAVYAGHWLKPALDLVHRSGEALASRPVWLFSSGPVGDPSRKLVQQMAEEEPKQVATVRRATRARGHRMFAGKLERRRLSRPQRVAMTVFRAPEGDFRDWPGIEAWADGIADDLALSPNHAGSACA